MGHGASACVKCTFPLLVTFWLFGWLVGSLVGWLVDDSLWLTQTEDDNCSISETHGNLNSPVQPILKAYPSC